MGLKIAPTVGVLSGVPACSLLPLAGGVPEALLPWDWSALLPGTAAALAVGDGDGADEASGEALGAGEAVLSWPSAVTPGGLWLGTMVWKLDRRFSAASSKSVRRCCAFWVYSGMPWTILTVES